MGGVASGLGDIGSGVANMFSGDSGAPGPQAAGLPSDTLFGMPVPSTTAGTSPSFMQGFAQGFTGVPLGKGFDTVGAGGKVGGGIGELVRAIQAMKDPMSSANPLTGPIVNLLPQQLRGPEMAPGYKPAGQPTNIIQSLLASYTGGLLGSNKMGM